MGYTTYIIFSVCLKVFIIKQGKKRQEKKSPEFKIENYYKQIGTYFDLDHTEQALRKIYSLIWERQDLGYSSSLVTTSWAHNIWTGIAQMPPCPE